MVAGCGASTQAAAASQVATEQQRDPEDYSLDPIQLQVTNIEEFDAVFGRLQELLNRFAPGPHPLDYCIDGLLHLMGVAASI
jgi:hypothetical protein